MWNKFNPPLDILGTAMFWALCLVVLLQVVCRFILKIPSPWTEEIARYLLIQITFLPAAPSPPGKKAIEWLWIFGKGYTAASFPAGIIIRGPYSILPGQCLRCALSMMAIAGIETATSLRFSCDISTSTLGWQPAFSWFVSYTLINILRTPGRERYLQPGGVGVGQL